MLSADFDGNGQLDYAVYLRPHSRAKLARLEVFLRKGSHFRTRCIDQENAAGQLILALGRKGTRDFNYTDSREFTYRLPTIQLLGEKGGYSYLYSNGLFRRIISSD